MHVTKSKYYWNLTVVCFNLHEWMLYVGKHQWNSASAQGGEFNDDAVIVILMLRHLYTETAWPCQGGFQRILLETKLYSKYSFNL